MHKKYDMIKMVSEGVPCAMLKVLNGFVVLKKSEYLWKAVKVTDVREQARTVRLLTKCVLSYNVIED